MIRRYVVAIAMRDTRTNKIEHGYLKWFIGIFKPTIVDNPVDANRYLLLDEAKIFLNNFAQTDNFKRYFPYGEFMYKIKEFEYDVRELEVDESMP